MLYLLLFLLALAAAAYGLEWVIDQPGSLSLDWGAYHVDTSIPVAVGVLLLVVAALIIAWAAISAMFQLPQRLRYAFSGRRRDKGYSALSRGIIAVGAGDAGAARRAAMEAEKYLQNEPLTQLLKAQAAQLEGDRRKAEAAFQQMTQRPETKLLGLRGLHIEARRREDPEAAAHFAEAAHEIAPLPWAANAVLEHYATLGDWAKTRATIEENLKAKVIDYPTAQRYRAVVETAMAMEKQLEHPHDALHLARQALKRRPNFVPAAVVAARVLTRHGDAKKAAKLIETVWAANPHPDLAAAYKEMVPGESNTELLARVEKLAAQAPDSPVSRLLVAEAALAARNFGKARAAIAPLVAEGSKPTAHTCLLMAEIEDAEVGPSGAVREWLARGSRAPRDPVWVADGVVSKTWAPVSPKTSKLDAFEWTAPPDPDAAVTTEGRPNIPAAFLATPEPMAITAAVEKA